MTPYHLTDTLPGYKLKLLRLAKHLSQFEVELNAGISQGVLSRIENNKLQPTVSTLIKIIRILQPTTSQLYFLFSPLMEPKKYIFVKQKEYEEFKYTSHRTNRILQFWIYILHSMPDLLHKESKRKPTNLTQQSKGEFEITGAKPFQFETNGASENLKSYLDQFAVFVEDDSKEVYKWREDISLLRRGKESRLNVKAG
jgi:transcriptional regulator with XRE-family HTH domain